MKKKLSKILSMMLAVIMVITGATSLSATDAKAADTPSFTVKVSSTEVRPGDTVHVELWVEGATDVISLVGNVNLDPNVYTVDRRSMQFGDLYTLSSQMGGMPQILPNDDQSYSIMLDFMGPAETTGMVFSFDATVNENASGSGAIAFEYIGAERGTSDTDRHDVPASDIAAPTIDMEGNVIEGGIIPVVIELESIALDKAEPFTMTKGSTDTLSVIATPGAALDGRIVEWSSSDEDVVSVDQSGNITAVGAGSATVSASVGGFTASVVITVTVPLTDIALDAESIQLRKNETQTLTVLFTPADATDATAVTWTSSDDTVASVDENGTVAALKEGTAVITAAVGDLTAECTVLVQEVPLESIALNRTEITMNKGTVSEPLQVLYNPNDTTDDKDVIWTSSNEEVATVEDGAVSAIAEGTATVTATVGAHTASCTVTVREIHVQDAALADSNPSVLYVGQRHTIDIDITPENTTDELSYTYESSDETVATVDADGAVEALKAGNTEITITVSTDDSDFTKELVYELEVQDIALDGIAFREEVTPLEVGQTAQLEIIFNPENTTVDRTVVWGSSDSSVATVKNGLVTALKAGTTVISAAVGDKEISYELTVTEKQTPSEPSDPSNPSGTPSDDQNQGSDGQVNNQTNGGAVQTGDTGNIFVILLTLFISLSAIVLIVLKGRGKRVHR